jgi:hypothetical protein
MEERCLRHQLDAARPGAAGQHAPDGRQYAIDENGAHIHAAWIIPPVKNCGGEPIIVRIAEG